MKDLYEQWVALKFEIIETRHKLRFYRVMAFILAFMHIINFIQVVFF